MKEVEKKWKSLRTQYTREKAKVKKRKSGDSVDDVYRSKWLHLSQMNFIDAYVTPKTSLSNLKVSKQCMHKSVSYYSIIIIAQLNVSRAVYM